MPTREEVVELFRVIKNYYNRRVVLYKIACGHLPSGEEINAEDEERALSWFLRHSYMVGDDISDVGYLVVPTGWSECIISYWEDYNPRDRNAIRREANPRRPRGSPEQPVRRMCSECGHRVTFIESTDGLVCPECGVVRTRTRARQSTRRRIRPTMIEENEIPPPFLEEHLTAQVTSSSGLRHVLETRELSVGIQTYLDMLNNLGVDYNTLSDIEDEWYARKSVPAPTFESETEEELTTWIEQHGEGYLNFIRERVALAS